MEQIGEEAVNEDEDFAETALGDGEPFTRSALGKGVYPPVGEKLACKEMKGKGIGRFLLSHNGNDGR
jgi:hypothetical protein